jgi:hypothetical protein
MPDRGRAPLVFATCRPPYPLNNGARIRTFELLTGLAEEFDTVMVTFDHHPDSPDGNCSVVQARQLIGDIEVLTVPGAQPGRRSQQLASLASRSSWSNGRYMSPAFSAAVLGAAAARPGCLVHFDDLGVAQVGPVPRALSVYSSHNIEQRILRHAAGTGGPPRRIFNAVEATKVRREEERTWRSMDLSLAVSELDGATMEQGGARHVELCPNGAPEVAPLPLRRPGDGEPLRLLFVGSGNYAPYERGLAWIAREVMPRLAGELRVTLDIVGQPPVHQLDAPGVNYVGGVPSVQPYYEAAHVVVVPVFEGSGTRLKMLEAMAYGRPVVSTGLGAEGLPVLAGEHYLRADDPETFAAAVRELDRRWRDPADERLPAMLSSAREAVAELFWPRVVKRLIALYRSQLDDLNAAAPLAAGNI